ncbi:hypothetical protein [Streptomyces dysideae]|uniref:Uncharacterized protein n=1 Tax=Streptomyces dysideae TaxID=909626 RepID=A0A101V4J6_9ACTN|nr:hypothetical protein [Streptomyces dysideae]KUO22380.1 hypothetical protein AQJ91_04210 [Streptomyces dysideae]
MNGQFSLNRSRSEGALVVNGAGWFSVYRRTVIPDADILHIVEVAAIFNYNVRLATATGLFPNPGYHELGRTSAAEG